MRDDPEGASLPPRERAIVDFAIRLTRDPAGTGPGDLDGLRAHGLEEEDLLVLVHVIGFFNHINRVADGLGIDLEPDMPPPPAPN